MHRVCVVGTGYVGLPLATLLSRDYVVVGFDVDTEKISQLSAGRTTLQEPGLSDALTSALAKRRLRFTSRVEEAAGCDVKILTVGTPYDHGKKDVDYSQLDHALELIGAHLSARDVLIIKSTVPPGTTVGRVKSLVETCGFRVPEDIGLVFAPERIVEGQALSDFVRLPKIIGATDDRSYDVARDVLGSLGGSVRRVSGPTTAELVKLVDNYSRYVFLGLANEIALMSEKVGVDALDLIAAAKFEYPRNSGILLPGPGVGGSCLNKDPLILASVMEEEGLALEMGRAASLINQSIPNHVAELVVRFAGPRQSVLVAGVSFKKDTDDTRFTPASEISRLLRVRGYSVTLSDPFVKLRGLKIERDLLVGAKNVEVLLILTDHSVYQEIDLADLKTRMASAPLIIDTRGAFDRRLATQLGFEYHGYGRL